MTENPFGDSEFQTSKIFVDDGYKMSHIPKR